MRYLVNKKSATGLTLMRSANGAYALYAMRLLVGRAGIKPAGIIYQVTDITSAPESVIGYMVTQLLTNGTARYAIIR
jgi:hypothetical protein